MISASVPESHMRPKRPTEETWISLMLAVFSASLQAMLIYAAGAHSNTSMVSPATSIEPRRKRLSNCARCHPSAMGSGGGFPRFTMVGSRNETAHNTILSPEISA